MRKLISLFALSMCCFVASAAYAEEVTTSVEAEQTAQDDSVTKNDAKLFKKEKEESSSGCPCGTKPKN
ncbi:MAG: hypothetical protein V4487_00305 [Chlamydiota bacterium]